WGVASVCIVRSPGNDELGNVLSSHREVTGICPAMTTIFCWSVTDSKTPGGAYERLDEEILSVAVPAHCVRCAGCAAKLWHGAARRSDVSRPGALLSVRGSPRFRAQWRPHCLGARL